MLLERSNPAIRLLCHQTGRGQMSLARPSSSSGESFGKAVVIGACPESTKEVVALEDGYREPTESWLALCAT